MINQKAQQYICEANRSTCICKQELGKAENLRRVQCGREKKRDVPTNGELQILSIQHSKHPSKIVQQLLLFCGTQRCLVNKQLTAINSPFKHSGDNVTFFL